MEELIERALCGSPDRCTEDRSPLHSCHHPGGMDIGKVAEQKPMPIGRHVIDLKRG